MISGKLKPSFSWVGELRQVQEEILQFEKISDGRYKVFINGKRITWVHPNTGVECAVVEEDVLFDVLSNEEFL